MAKKKPKPKPKPKSAKKTDPSEFYLKANGIVGSLAQKIMGHVSSSPAKRKRFRFPQDLEPYVDAINQAVEQQAQPPKPQPKKKSDGEQRVSVQF